MLFFKPIPVWSREHVHVQFVRKRVFAPRTLDVIGDYIVSTLGRELHHALLVTTSPEYVTKAAGCAFSALDELHKLNMWHLDAKASNFIVCPGQRTKGIAGPTDFIYNSEWYHVAIIDYDTLFAPLQVSNGFDKKVFDNDAVLLSSLGRKSFDEFMEMPAWQRDRADTFSLAASFLYGPQGNPVMDNLLSACRRILGHVPRPSYYTEENNKLVKYYTYLADFEKPVATNIEARAYIAVAHFSDSLKHNFSAAPNQSEIVTQALALCNGCTTTAKMAVKLLDLPEKDATALFAYLE